MANNVVTLAIEYFKAFSERNIPVLTEMFDRNAELIDWEVDIKGVNNILAFNKKFFDSIENLEIRVVNIANVDTTVLAQIEVIINRKTIVEVVDIITFNNKKKITQIKAFKR